MLAKLPMQMEKQITKFYYGKQSYPKFKTISDYVKLSHFYTAEQNHKVKFLNNTCHNRVIGGYNAHYASH